MYRKDASPTALYEVGLKALLDALKKNDILEVKCLLSQGIDVNQQDYFSETPLYWACMYSTHDSHFDVIKLLLKNGADVNLGKISGPLLMIANENEVKTIKLLLDHKADVNVKDCDGFTPLHTAVQSNNFDVVQLLVDYGSEVNTTSSEYGMSPLHTAVDGSIEGTSIEIVQLLLRSGADPNAVEAEDGATPLHLACKRQNLKIIKLLLKYGANIHANDNIDFTPLECMLLNNDYILKKTLLFLLHNVNFRSKGFDIFCSSQNESSDRVILEHAVILLTLEFSLGSSFDQILDAMGSEYYEYFVDCSVELQLARTTKLKNSWVTFFNLLVDSRKKLKNYAGNEDLVNDFKNSECSKKFKIYGAVMQKNMEKGIKRRELFDKSCVLLSYFLPIFNPSHIIIRDILDCMLSKKDLSNFCQ